MAAPTPTQVTPTPSSTQIPSMVEVNPITHVPSKIYFSNPPVIFPEPDEDETILIQNAQEMIDQLVSDKILNKALRGSLESSNPLFACLKAKLMPVNPDLGSPGWDQYLPTATDIDRLSLTQLSIADTDQDSMRDIDQGSTRTPTAPDRLWGGDTTNLSLVIADEFKAKWSPRRKSSKIYVRVSYITAAELIFAYYVNPDNDQHVILNGTPGTGKTMFANVFFWRLLQLSMANPDRCSHSNPFKKHPVLIYQPPNGQGCLYMGGEFYRVPKLGKLVISGDLEAIVRASGERAWLITDTNPIPCDDTSGYLNQIYIASTGISNSHQNKVFTRDAELSLITPIWSRAEIHELFDLSYTDEKVITRSKLDRLFDICGGIPRTLFDNAPHFNINANNEIQLSRRFASKLEKADWEKIFTTLAKRQSFDHITDFDDAIISSMIFHLVPHPIPREKYGQRLQQTAKFKWCSPWTAFRAIQMLEKVEERKSALFLLSKDYGTAAMSGHVYEGICISILTRSATPLCCRLKMLTPLKDLVDEAQLHVNLITYLNQHGFQSVTQISIPSSTQNPAPTDTKLRKVVGRIQWRPRRVQPAPTSAYIENEVIVQFPRLDLCFFKDNNDIKSMSNQPADTLWVPFQNNYEGIDAVMPQQGVMFQMTRQPKYNVSLKNVDDFLKIGVFPRPAMEGSLLLIFMVPKDRYGSYTHPQTFTHLGRQGQGSVDTWLHQAVIEVDLEKEYVVM